MQLFVLILYLLALLFVFLYSMSQLQLLFYFIKAVKNSQHQKKKKLSLKDKSKLPFVSVQLPIYNEKLVVERLLKKIAQLEYPREKLEIQVLDDSTDSSLQNTKKLVENLQKTGLNIKHIHRKDRKDYKAGALREALKTAKGEFIAIFDADFLPKKDWLLQTLPYFEKPEIGVVQTRWGHLNKDYSLLTKIQAFALDYHFILEQVGRSFGKHFINFNGTAGIWRKTCILDAGNWQGDTLTEDLDLSYRAQLKNWKFIYLKDVISPAELPVTIAAAKSQQFRWNKGAAENFKKNFLKIIRNSGISWQTKTQSFFHLLNSSMFLAVLTIAVLSLPVLFIKNQHPEWQYLYLFMAGLGVSTLIFFSTYWVAFSTIYAKSFKSFFKFLGLFFSFFTVAVGLSLHNSIAVLEGYRGKRSAFVRTPKFNIQKTSKKSKTLTDTRLKFTFSLFLEILLTFYFAYAIYVAFALTDFSLLFFHLMLFLGFGFVSLQSLKARG